MYFINQTMPISGLWADLSKHSTAPKSAYFGISAAQQMNAHVSRFLYTDRTIRFSHVKASAEPNAPAMTEFQKRSQIHLQLESICSCKLKTEPAAALVSALICMIKSTKKEKPIPASPFSFILFRFSFLAYEKRPQACTSDSPVRISLILCGVPHKRTRAAC